MMLKNRFIKLIVRPLSYSFILLLLVISPATAAQVKIVEVKGLAVDRASALSDAKRLAVEQMVGIYVDSKTSVENNTEISDEIYTKAGSFISRYRILGEGKNGTEGNYFVKIRAVVPLRPVIDALKDLGILKQWKIMVSIPSAPSCEKELIKKLVRAGYPALKSGAEILISGEATVEPIAENGKKNFIFKSARAKLSLRVIRVDSGETITFESASASAKDISGTLAGKKALTRAADGLADGLIDTIIMVPASSARIIQVVLHKLNPAEVRNTAEQIKAIPGVKNTRIIELGAGTGYLDVEYTGKSSDLAKGLKSLKLKIIALSGNRIDAKK